VSAEEGSRQCGKCGAPGVKTLSGATFCIKHLDEFTTPLNPAVITDPDYTDTTADGYHYTDAGNSRRFADLHGHEARYVVTWGQWIVWDGRRWATDHGHRLVIEMAKDVPRHLWHQISNTVGADRKRLATWASRSEMAPTLKATVELAAGMTGIRTRHDELDTNPWSFNVANGTLHLMTGELLPHDPANLITHISPIHFDRSATCPEWTRFLERVVPDPDVRRYLQRLFGYSLTGHVEEQILPMVIGPGANGKSVLFTILRKLAGEYGTPAPRDLLLAQRHEPHPTSVATLFGKRVATAVETEAGSQLAEAKVKELTGGDELTARRMREDFWSFIPTHQLWLAANHRPVVHGGDSAIWRRIRVIPFEVVIPPAERDPGLLDRLLLELPGILAWAVEGASQWALGGGLGETPEAVDIATSQYQGEQDVVGQFLDSCSYVVAPGRWTPAGELREDFQRWVQVNGLDTMTTQEFAEAMRSRGCASGKKSEKRVWNGVGKRLQAVENGMAV